MLTLFRTKKLLDDNVNRWLYDGYAWALRNFGSDIFYYDTVLVTPTDQHFPDRVENPEQMMAKIFDRVRAYAGMTSWPCELLALNTGDDPVLPPAVTAERAPRGPAGHISVSGDRPYVPIVFDRTQLGNPELLVAGFARELGGYLCAVAPEEPPGGAEYRGHAADLLAVFMGFGVFMANTAFMIKKGGCSGCGITVHCHGNLTEDEFTYALAMFAALKGIEHRGGEPSLKSSLRPFYRKAVREIMNDADAIVRLKDICCPITPAMA